MVAGASSFCSLEGSFERFGEGCGVGDWHTADADDESDLILVDDDLNSLSADSGG